MQRQLDVLDGDAAFLETVTQVDVSTLSLVLLGIGIAGVVGTSLIGGFLKDGLYRTLIVIPVSMAVIAVFPHTVLLTAFASPPAFGWRKLDAPLRRS